MCRRVLLSLTILLLAAQAAPASTATTRPLPGVALEKVVETDPPLRYFLASIDLADPGIHLKVSRGGGDAPVSSPWETTLLPVSQIAQRDGLSVAINGNFFDSKDFRPILGKKVWYFPGNWARACGWAMNDGHLFSNAPVDRDWPSMIVSDSGKISFGRFVRLPPDARQVVSGIAQIITDGLNTAKPDNDQSDAAKPMPHAVAGVDRLGKTLFLLVVDGRRPDYSVGMTHHRMAQVLLAAGAWNAIVLDGGGSATLVMRDSQGTVQVLNRPSDGHELPIDVSVERSVAVALGVVIDGVSTQPDR